MDTLEIIANSEDFAEWIKTGGTPKRKLIQLVYDFNYPDETPPTPNKAIKKDIIQFLSFLKEQSEK